MVRRTALLTMLQATLAPVLGRAAPVPREDWWLEVQDPRRARHFVRAATGERQAVRKPPSAGRFEIPSPDAKWVAKLKDRPQPEDTDNIHDRKYDLVVHPAGDEKRAVNLGGTPDHASVQWTRDSKRVVFLTDRDGWRAYSAAPDGTDVRRLTQTRASALKPSGLRLLPDGRALFFSCRKQVDFKPTETMTVSRASGDLIVCDGDRDRVLCRDALVGSFEPSPGGTHVAYEISTPSTVELVVHDLRSGRAERLQMREFRPEWDCWIGELMWRPDGAAVAFSTTFPYILRVPEDQTPFRHIGIAEVGPAGLRVRFVSFGEWARDEKGHGALGYSLVRWVPATEVRVGCTSTPSTATRRRTSDQERKRRLFRLPNRNGCRTRTSTGRGQNREV